MFRVKLYYPTSTGENNYIVLEADTLEELQEKGYKFIKELGVDPNLCWSTNVEGWGI